MKHIALYKLFPKLVNISLPFITDEHSEYFQRILVRGCQVDWGTDSAKVKHFPTHMKLASDLISSGGLILTPTLEEGKMKNFKRVL